MRHSLSGLIVSLCAVGPCWAATAEVDVWLTDVTFVLTDLTPRDGQAAYFDPYSVSNMSYLDIDRTLSYDSSTVFGEATSADLNVSGSSASSSTSLTTYHTDLATSALPEEWIITQAKTDIYAMLAPNSSVTISATATIDKFVDIEGSTLKGSASIQAANVTNWEWSGDGLSEPGTKDLSITFVNSSKVAVPFLIYIYAAADFRGAYTPPPVPEPSTAALMLGGLVMAAAVVRRRNSPTKP